MPIPIPRSFCTAGLLAALAAAHVGASPADSRLLRLVPPGAEIVAGIANPGVPGTSGRLLVVTANNNRDLDDCLALLGVDPGETIDELVEVASSSPEGDLNDHLLLLAGHFDGPRIFRAAVENGAESADYHGTALLAIKPFPRELQQMSALRWMAILNGRTLVFGVPGLVERALDRYAQNQPANPRLVERLAQLPSDVNSWSIIAMAPSMLDRHLAPDALPESWRNILKNADELAVGIHYGRTAHVDFAIHTRNSDLIGRFQAQPQLNLANLFQVSRLREQKVSAEKDCIRGSFTVKEKEFDAWLESVERRRSLAPGTR